MAASLFPPPVHQTAERASSRPRPPGSSRGSPGRPGAGRPAGAGSRPPSWSRRCSAAWPAAAWWR